MVEQIVIILHLFIAIAVIGLILIQQGKGADAGASFGSGASQTIFGSQGSGNFLTKTTSWLAFAFFATSFGLAIIAKDKAGTLVDVDIPQIEQTETTVSEGATKDSDVPNTEAQPGSVKETSHTELPVVEPVVEEEQK